MVDGKPVPITSQDSNLQTPGFDERVDIQKNMNLNEICFVMEMLEQDMNLMLKNHTDNFTESHMIKMVYHTLCSIAFLHEANVIHRDIKPANILITPNCNATLCDLGLARTLPPGSSDRKGYNSKCVREAYCENIQDVSNSI